MLRLSFIASAILHRHASWCIQLRRTIDLHILPDPFASAKLSVYERLILIFYIVSGYDLTVECKACLEVADARTRFTLAQLPSEWKLGTESPHPKLHEGPSLERYRITALRQCFWSSTHHAMMGMLHVEQYIKVRNTDRIEDGSSRNSSSRSASLLPTWSSGDGWSGLGQVSRVQISSCPPRSGMKVPRSFLLTLLRVHLRQA